MTAAQARERNAAVAQEVIAVLPVKPQTVRALGTGSSPCLVNPDAQENGTVEYGAGYDLIGITPDQGPAVFAGVRKALEAKHYRFVYATTGTLQMHSPDDSTNLTMDQADSGVVPLHLTVTSPCVWPDESPTPTPSPTRDRIP
ncbi:hypothetical protein ACFZB9_31740 [Kitasatospora sp. NPDC008050]|uniref:hypothetical protein n=1 Tax=Kitasatospora sp. NPDC008050 TaxID=3364021 RepID=UPI0036F0D342